MTPHSLTVAEISAGVPAETRVAGYDWKSLAGALDDNGSAILPKLLSAVECRAIAALYPEEGHFRSHIHMARHGFGKGEYSDPPAALEQPPTNGDDDEAR